MLQEEINCETTISVREAASNQSLSGGQGFLKCSCKIMAPTTAQFSIFLTLASVA
jgi:hypothetical protein